MSDNNLEYQNTFNNGSHEFELGQYIYLLQEREFIKTKENIYKLGKTKQQHNKRFAQYPKNSKLLTQLICDDCDKIERILINLFNEKFEKRKDIGNEYFEGDYKYMIDLIYNTIKQEETKKEVDEKEEFKYDIECSDEGIEYSDEEIDINTYEDYIQFSNISQVIITNRKKMEGYVKFDDSFMGWCRIDENEDLEGFIEHNQYNNNIIIDRNIKCKNLEDIKKNILVKENYDRINYWEVQGLYNFNYNSDKIINDIIKKCYKKVNYCDLKYNEFVININSKLYIYDTICNQFKILEEYEKDYNGIIRDTFRQSIIKTPDINNINIEIVDKIMNILIKDKDVIRDFKQFAYNVFVKKSEETFIFYDNYNNSFKDGLTEWLHHAYFKVTDDGIFTSSMYYKDVSKYKTQIKKEKPRFVIIKGYSSEQLSRNSPVFENTNKCKKAIQDLKSLGIKNIIVHTASNEKNNIYNNENDYKNIINYLNDNKNLFLPYICDKEFKIKCLDDIFYKSDLLFINFFVWCCSK